MQIETSIFQRIQLLLAAIQRFGFESTALRVHAAVVGIALEDVHKPCIWEEGSSCFASVCVVSRQARSLAVTR